MLHRLLLLVLVWLPSAAALASATVARRAVLQQASTAAAFAAAAAFGPPRAALADLADLDAEEPVGAAMAPKEAAVQVITMEDATAKPKKKEMSTPGQRLKELQAKGNLSDKEKKELRKLKADEMCEMLGRGC